MKSKVRRLIEMPQRRAATLWHALALALALVSMVACGGPEPQKIFDCGSGVACHSVMSICLPMCVCPSIDSLAAWRLELRPVVPTHNAGGSWGKGRLALIVAYLLLESSCGRTLI